MIISFWGILFAVISMVTLGLAVAMAKIPSQTVGVRRFIFWRQATTSFLLFSVLFLLGHGFSFWKGYFGIAIAIAMFSYFALISAYQALKRGKVGMVSPIISSSLIITVLFSVVFLDESLSFFQFISIAFVALGVIIMSLNFSDLKSSDLLKLSSGVPFALIASLIWGIAYALYKIPVAVIGPLLTAFAIEFGSFLPNIPGNILTKTSFALPDKKTLAQIIVIGIIAAASTLFYNLGIRFSEGNVSLVAAIVFSNPIISTLYGFFVYKERLSAKQWFALTLTISGIAGISLF